MVSPREELEERRRVLVLFGASVLPPLVLLGILTILVARNDELALRHLEREQAQELVRQSAQSLKRRLERAIAQAEEDVFREVDLSSFRSGGEPEELAEALEACRERRGYVARFFALAEGGDVVWPRLSLPYHRLGSGEVLGGSRLEEEVPGRSLQDYQVRARLLAMYAQARERALAGDAEAAAAGFESVAGDPRSSVTLSARARFRLGECLEALGRAEEARSAWEGVAAASWPVRDEGGRPLRVEAALRASRGAGEAERLGRALLAGDYREDLTESEFEALRGRLVEALREAGGEAASVWLEEAARSWGRERAWVEALRGELGASVWEEAARALGGELGHVARLEEPPRVVVFRVLPRLPEAAQGAGVRTGRLVVGFQLEVEGLVEEVLGPVCEAEDGGAVAVLDARRVVRAYAGEAARPAAETGRLSEGGEVPGATASLEPLPLWSVRALRPLVVRSYVRGDRVALYGSLVGLTLLAAFLGGRATLRYVRRSLELAHMKQDLISNITHELKTPLTSIKLYGELLASERPRAGERRREYAGHVVIQADRLQKLIDDILDFARLDSGAGEASYVLAEEDVASTVSEALDLFRHSAKAHGFDLFVELPPVGELPPVDLDRDAVIRAVLNLLSNAVKYSADVKYLKVSVRRQGLEQVAVVVEDKGIGIDPEDLERIFDRFYRAGDPETREVSGTGLGLALVDHIVHAHDGEIEVESEKGAGTTFTVLLPIVEDYRQRWPIPTESASTDATSDSAPAEESESEPGADAP